MNALTPDRRLRAVGDLGALSPMERAAIAALRAWCAPVQGADTPLAQMFELITQFGRRPLSLRAEGDPWLGADEACLATILSYASEGAHEDALLLAAHMVRADVAPYVATLARDAAVSWRREYVAQQSTIHRAGACPAQSMPLA